MTKYIEREKVVELFNKWSDGYSYIYKKWLGWLKQEASE
jgi:hypothetical protein